MLVGPSGCGKTTTLRMIAGFEDPTGGEIRIDGQVVNDLEPRDRGLGMVFQSHALFPHKTVAQNIEFGLRMKKVPRGERAQARARSRRDGAHRPHLLDKMPSQCSGGESQRVALARTLVTNPSTFLLDEPLSSLDAKLRRELRAECDRLHQALQRTFIYVTHDQEEAMTLADRIVVMRAGEIVQVGSPMEIYSDPVNYFVADFFGSPSMNLLAGEIVRENGAAALPRAALRDRAARALQAQRRPAPPRSASGPSMSASRAAASGDVELAGALVEPLGKDTLLYFDAGTERAFVAVSEGLAMADVKVGAHVALRSTRAGCTCSTRTDSGSTGRHNAASAGNRARRCHIRSIATLQKSRNPWTTEKRAKSATACGSTGTCRSRWTTASCCAATSTGRSPRANIR